MSGRYYTKHKILIVDDEPEVHLATEVLLKAMEYEIVRASNGGQGVREARRLRPDLILLDVDMPHMDGVTALKLLRDLAETKSTPVIMLTGNANYHIVTKILESGVEGYLKKPYDPKVLLGRIQEILFPESVVQD